MKRVGNDLVLTYGTHPTDTDTYWEVTGPYSDTNPAPWASSDIQHVNIDASVAEATPSNCAYWFANMGGLTSVEGLPYLNTSDATSFASMFAGDSGLASLDLSTFDTESVTDISHMFAGCSSLNGLDLSKVDFNGRTVNTTGAFEGCTDLATLRMGSGYVTPGSAIAQNTFPLSAAWIAYQNGEPVQTSGFDTAQGWIDYFTAHPGITTFVKEGETITVSFFANGGTFADGATVKAESGKAGQDTLSVPENPTRANYTFIGWASTPLLTEPDLPADLPLFGFSDLSYYALWTQTQPGPEPTPEPTPEPSGDIVPITGDPFATSITDLFIAALIAGGLALLLSRRVSRK